MRREMAVRGLQFVGQSDLGIGATAVAKDGEGRFATVMPTQWGDTMGFFEVLTQGIELLQRHERVSYRALKREFDLDDAYLDDLKAEIIQAKKLAVDEDGVGLVWMGNAAPASSL